MLVVLSVFSLFVIFILSVFSSRCLITVLDFSADSARKTYPVLALVFFVVYSVCCTTFFYFFPQPKAVLHNFLNPSTEARSEAKPSSASGQHPENAGQSSAYSTLPTKETTVSEHNSNSSQSNEGHPQEEQAAPQEPAVVPPQPSSLPLVIEEPITPLLRPQRPPVIVESKRPVMITPSSPPKPKKDKRGKEGVASVQGEARQKNPAPKESDSCKSIKDTMDNMDRKMFLEIKKGVAPTNILINPINGNIYRVFPQSGQGNSRCGSYRIDATINGKNISCSETACD